MTEKIALTTNLLDPQRRVKTSNINKGILEILPLDYLRFLEEYGAGTYCEEVVIHYPDEIVIPETFKDDTDLWELDEMFTAEDLLNAIQIGRSFNGDIICVTRKKAGSVFVLPRHSLNVVSFNRFEDAIHYLTRDYRSFKFYLPGFDHHQLQISLIKEGGLKDINPIHESFLDEFKFDFVIHSDTQPKYFFKEPGFWIRFDLIYKNSISMGYQKQLQNKSQHIMDRIEELSK
ncbi:hypothetical protein [Pedobacter caeni]|uniref:SMI1/KNR4 family protein n=1 Tax=Pedobacter caeni TaxID=288992 RepID=A0A1M4WCL6_9SPHI|nr:hypothetical protein [Pedobacter caeni]SHE79031.1 hypothetical protein SAMN04488522_1011222 [Pedobacter caeni]